MNYEKLLTSKQKLYLKNLYFTIKLRILNTVREQIKTDKKVDLNVLETELVLDNIKYNYFVFIYRYLDWNTSCIIFMINGIKQ